MYGNTTSSVGSRYDDDGDVTAPERNKSRGTESESVYLETVLMSFMCSYSVKMIGAETLPG